jgi:hypothetical protein
LLEAGIEATHGERNRASVVAFAIASVVPASGISAGVSTLSAAEICAKRKILRAKKSTSSNSQGSF